MRGRNPQYIKSLHDVYGPVVRINPNELSYIDGQAWRDIYALRPHGKESFEKDPVFEGPDFVGENGVARAKGDAHHGRVRKTFSHAFSERALKEQESIFQAYVNQMIENIRRRFDAGDKAITICISDLYNFTTFDIMGDLAFGEPLGLLNSGSYTEWVEAVFDNFKLAVFGQVLRAYPVMDALFQFLLPASLQEQRKKQQLFTTERVDKRLARKTDRPDIWTYVMRQEASNPLTLPEMYSSASTFMLAGTETTATLLSGLTYLLLKNKPVLEKLLAEIHTVIKTDADITMQNLVPLRYLNACIEEALRFYPPVPCPLPRVVPKQGAAICGKWVAGGVSFPDDVLARDALTDRGRRLWVCATTRPTIRRTTLPCRMSLSPSGGWMTHASLRTSGRPFNHFRMAPAAAWARREFTYRTMPSGEHNWRSLPLTSHTI